MAKEHIDYLEKVLENWTEFCLAHRLLAEAIAEVVKDAKLLEALRKLIETKSKEKTDDDTESES